MMTSRVQLARNVADIRAATTFHRDLSGVGPARRRPGYDNFEIVDRPLKLVLLEAPGATSPLNHLGVDVPSAGLTAAEGSASHESHSCAPGANGVLT
jgi:hypothetical protein